MQKEHVNVSNLSCISQHTIERRWFKDLVNVDSPRATIYIDINFIAYTRYYGISN